MAKEEPEPEKVEYDVTVLSRREVAVSQKLGQTVYAVMVTYVGADMGPAVLRIPKDEYSLELEKKLIRSDIEKRLKIRPEAYKV